MLVGTKKTQETIIIKGPIAQKEPHKMEHIDHYEFVVMPFLSH